ncbi:hypothetical protein BWQ96_08755 [Gracilariopsis chorda]|uniref:Uncharacterized protein n=1 Tax=Gracilariopsis chorda TaxID=448386 RepID=A0A2V3IHK6_9FLOR|nr:hypothetical protein BWQ96_08755 [Gracilariopsis chorda]|eukprot:PXF41552.1 hypothetical protein BWQ96_08755 [Gracilariopsis chorda]
MFRACKPSLPRASPDKTHPHRTAAPDPPAAVQPAAEPPYVFRTPTKDDSGDTAESQNQKSHAQSFAREPQPLTMPPPPSEVCSQPYICTLEPGWEYKTVRQPALTQEDVLEDLTREVRPERQISPDNDPLLDLMFSMFPEPTAEE